MDDYEDYDNYQVGYAQLQQLGGPDKNLFTEFATIIGGGGGIGGVIRAANRYNISPIERFEIICNIFYKKFGGGQGNSSFVISQNTISTKAQNLKWVEYKNPITFIMGAYIIGKDNKIDNRRIQLLNTLKKSIPDAEYIAIEDIIRYGRIWEYLLKK